MCGGMSRPGSSGCSTTENAPPVISAGILKSTPTPPSHTDSPSPASTTFLSSVAIAASFRFTLVSTDSATLQFIYSDVKRNVDLANLRAEAAGRAPAGDAATDCRSGRRAPHDARSCSDDGDRDRRAGGGDATNGVRALSRRPVAPGGVLGARARGGTASGSDRLALDLRS